MIAQKKKLQKFILNKLLNNPRFYISDTKIVENSNHIKKKFEIFNKKKQIQKIKNKKVLAVIEDGCGAVFWSNLLVSFLNNYTLMPIEKNKKHYKKISKYYDIIILFKGDQFKIVKNYKKKLIKELDKVDYISSTSGSTGVSKMILLNISSIIQNSDFIVKSLNYKKFKNFLIAIPFYFNSAICHFFTCLINQMNFFSFEKLVFPFNLNFLINKYSINYFGGAPIQAQWILSFKKINQKFEKLISSGDFLNKKNINLYLKKSKKKFQLYNIYGITELGGRVFFNKLGENKNPYSLGKNLSYQKIKLKKISKNIYELGIKSKFGFKGYYDKKLNTKVYETGTFYTNDLVKKENKSIELIGRKNEIFKSSGIKIFPELIKNEMMKLKKITNTFIFPHEFKYYGMAPVAAYESKKKISDSELINFLNGKIEKKQIPRKFIWWKKFPLLKNKKVNKLLIKKT
ncbi:class I adenylate-forming enzyme family protein [Candidatus Pelagibacter ubique]|nr:class I adenylate-forming enzyme family protein [Candidatus Pelagibacter ubique]